MRQHPGHIESRCCVCDRQPTFAATELPLIAFGHHDLLGTSVLHKAKTKCTGNGVLLPIQSRVQSACTTMERSVVALKMHCAWQPQPPAECAARPRARPEEDWPYCTANRARTQAQA